MSSELNLVETIFIPLFVYCFIIEKGSIIKGMVIEQFMGKPHTRSHKMWCT
jgi:hypothetical protein